MFKVVLEEANPSLKEQLIQVVAEVTGNDITKSTELVDTLPAVIVAAHSEEEARQIREQLLNAGAAKVSIVSQKLTKSDQQRRDLLKSRLAWVALAWTIWTILCLLPLLTRDQTAQELLTGLLGFLIGGYVLIGIAVWLIKSTPVHNSEHPVRSLPADIPVRHSVAVGHSEQPIRSLPLESVQESERHLTETIEISCSPDPQILNLLKASIPNRFMNMSPHEFEEFICQLFKDAGYQAQLTPQSGDFGADILLTKGDEKVAVQIKRYEQGRKVGVKDVNQAIGARDFYKCSKALVVTTATFSEPARRLAVSTKTDLWDWKKLYEKIKEVYLNGKDIYEYFPEAGHEAESQGSVSHGDFEFLVEQIQEKISMEDETTATIVYTVMENLTAEKKHVIIEAFPIIIDKLDNQFSAYCWLRGGFVGGDIYPYASVRIIACWYDWQVPQASAIDRVILRYIMGSESQEVVIPVSKSYLAT